MFKCDYHTHTRFSFDGAKNSTADSLCRAAIERGVTDLAITDHFECNWKAESAFPPYQAALAREEIFAAKEKYKDKLNLTYGIEMGQINQYPEEAHKLFLDNDYEFVICSIHNLRGAVDFCFMNFEKMFSYMPETYMGYLFERYIDEQLEALDNCDRISTVAHLTYMKRYCALSGNDYDFSKHFDKVEKLYRKMVSRDIALEVNVSTIWKGLGFPMPDGEFLELYRDCGGRLITVGSDSHSPDHVGECIEEGFGILRSVGLNNILVVRNGEKTIVKI